MTAIHHITGYEKRTERLEIEHTIPPERFSEIRQLAHVPPEDSGAVGAYPLDPHAAGLVTLKLDKPLNVDAYDWFLEPFSEA